MMEDDGETLEERKRLELIRTRPVIHTREVLLETTFMSEFATLGPEDEPWVVVHIDGSAALGQL